MRGANRREMLAVLEKALSGIAGVRWLNVREASATVIAIDNTELRNTDEGTRFYET